MSKLIKGDGSPLLSVDTYEAEAIALNQKVPSPPYSGRKEKTSYFNDPSVSSWNLPVVEKIEDISEKLEDLKAKLARLEREAYEKGFEQGQKDGLALEKSKTEEMARQMDKLFKGLRDLKPQIYSESEGELLKLAFLVVRKIVGEEVKTNPEVIGNTIRTAFKFLVDKRKVKIIINPDDMEDVRRIMPDLSKLSKGGSFQLTEDHSIEKGGCILETGFGRVNATIDDQIKNLEEEIEQEYFSAGRKSHEALSG